MFAAVAAAAASCPVPVHGSGDFAAPGVPPPSAITAPLEYHETDHPFLFRYVPVEVRSGPFAREPRLASGTAVRGVLKFGDHPSNATAFLWEPGAQKLFLDLNHNGDLTDDPAGVFSGSLTGPRFPGLNHQTFEDVRLAFPATSAGAPMLMDLDLFQNGDSGRLLVNAMVRSFWQGKVTVAGRDWQVGLVQNLSSQPGSFRLGQLLLRPWEERNHRFFAAGEKTEDILGLAWTGKNRMARASDAFAFSPHVFFSGCAWQLDWTAEPRGRQEKLALRLTKRQTVLGELRITGSFIHRVVLTGGPYVVVLADPAASVKVPPGRYQPYRIWLKQGEAQAYFNYGLPRSGKANALEELQFETGSQMPVVSPPPPEEAVVVDEQRTAVLAVGGPLTNSVSATRRGRTLLFNYRLIGVGGGEYWLAGGGGGKSPQLTVDRSGKTIESAEFEFG